MPVCVSVPSQCVCYVFISLPTVPSTILCVPVLLFMCASIPPTLRMCDCSSVDSHSGCASFRRLSACFGSTISSVLSLVGCTLGSVHSPLCIFCLLGGADVSEREAEIARTGLGRTGQYSSSSFPGRWHHRELSYSFSRHFSHCPAHSFLRTGRLRSHSQAASRLKIALLQTVPLLRPSNNTCTLGLELQSRVRSALERQCTDRREMHLAILQ